MTMHCHKHSRLLSLRHLPLRFMCSMVALMILGAYFYMFCYMVGHLNMILPDEDDSQGEFMPLSRNVMNAGNMEDYSTEPAAQKMKEQHLHITNTFAMKAAIDEHGQGTPVNVAAQSREAPMMKTNGHVVNLLRGKTLKLGSVPSMASMQQHEQDAAETSLSSPKPTPEGHENGLKSKESTSAAASIRVNLGFFQYKRLTAENTGNVHVMEHAIVSSSKQVWDFIRSDKTTARVMIFFVCDQDPTSGRYWAEECESSAQLVYQAFREVTVATILLEVQAGPASDWDGYQPMSEWAKNDVFKLPTLPSLMRLYGRNQTDRFLTGHHLLVPSLVQYVFQNPVAMDLLPPTQTIKRMSTLADFETFVDAYTQQDEAAHPLFVYFIAGRGKLDRRSWCPSCRVNEQPVEFAFRRSAHTHAVLLKVETAQTYPEWKDPHNEFKKNKYNFEFYFVPMLVRVKRAAAGKIPSFEEIPATCMQSTQKLEECFRRETLAHINT